MQKETKLIEANQHFAGLSNSIRILSSMVQQKKTMKNILDSIQTMITIDMVKFLMLTLKECSYV